MVAAVEMDSTLETAATARAFGLLFCYYCVVAAVAVSAAETAVAATTTASGSS